MCSVKSKLICTIVVSTSISKYHRKLVKQVGKIMVHFEILNSLARYSLLVLQLITVQCYYSVRNQLSQICVGSFKVCFEVSKIRLPF